MIQLINYIINSKGKLKQAVIRQEKNLRLLGYRLRDGRADNPILTKLLRKIACGGCSIKN